MKDYLCNIIRIIIMSCTWLLAILIDRELEISLLTRSYSTERERAWYTLSAHVLSVSYVWTHGYKNKAISSWQPRENIFLLSL